MTELEHDDVQLYAATQELGGLDEAAWLALIVQAIEAFPALLAALRTIFGGGPAGQKIRDILAVDSASARAARELRK